MSELLETSWYCVSVWIQITGNYRLQTASNRAFFMIIGLHANLLRQTLIVVSSTIKEIAAAKCKAP